jgi:hypothetical protein
MSQNEKKHNRPAGNRQVQRTCSWILDAILILMDKKPYDKITVSDIVNKAGIARQTFYRNFNDKDEVIVEYFANIFNSEMLSVENVSDKKMHDNIVLTFNVKYMTKHRVNIVKMLSIIGIEKMFADRFSEWQDLLFKQNITILNKEEQLVYQYKIHYQINGIILVIMDWFKNNMPVSVDSLVKLLNCFTVDTRANYKDVPNIKIRIIE